MQPGQLIPIRTDPATQFTATLAQNAALTLNLTAAPAGTAYGPGYIDPGLIIPSMKFRLRSIVVASVENLAWEVWLWSKDTFNASLTDPNLVYPVGRWTFAAADALRIGGAGLYYYYSTLIEQAYVDLDKSAEIHLMLVNRSAAAKTANAGGAILLQLNCEPTLGY